MAAGIGVFWRVFKQSGRWVAVKAIAATAATTAGLAAVGSGTGYGLQKAGADETTVRGAQLAAAIITLIVLHKVARKAGPQKPPPESQTGGGG